MGRVRSRVAACVVSLLAGALLAGCGAISHSAGGQGCTPRWPKTSDHVVRAGQNITLSASARTCSPTFISPRHLTVTAVDRQSHRTELATLQAFPSGAYEEEVRIPESAPAGELDLYVDGFELPCPGNGSCAPYMIGVDVVQRGAVFDHDGEPNHVASRVAERLDATLRDSETPVQLVIVPDGLQAIIESTSYDRSKAAVIRAFRQVRAALPEKDRAAAASARLHITNSSYSQSDLARLTRRIDRDQAWQGRHRLRLSAWGPDIGTGSVRIRMRHYTDAGAVLLTERYGDAVTVSTVDTPFAIAG